LLWHPRDGEGLPSEWALVLMEREHLAPGRGSTCIHEKENMRPPGRNGELFEPEAPYSSTWSHPGKQEGSLLHKEEMPPLSKERKHLASGRGSTYIHEKENMRAPGRKRGLS